MNLPSTRPFSVNSRDYTPPPRPVALICLDGSSDEYLDAALDRGLMPTLQRIATRGFRGLARAAMPTFTNVNNASIITGVPPLIHGLSGNFFYDSLTGQEVMMNSSTYLRCDTIPAAAARAGRKVGIVTAKEKLRDILSAGLFDGNQPASGAIAFSSEKAGEAARQTHGITNLEPRVGKPTPPIYSADASLYVLQAGAVLLEQNLADFLYLSTTDYIQHLHAPDEPEALQFYAAMDSLLDRLLCSKAVLAITADHGMNAKHKPDGSPNLIYLETELVRQFRPGFRVILPITDPYVVHHGALGSFAVVHLPPDTPAAPVAEYLLNLPGITEVWSRENAASKLQLPADRIGDIIVLSGRDVVLGRTPQNHDLSALKSPLRSHGGRYEEMVPLLLSEPLNPQYKTFVNSDPRNFDAFHLLLNGVQ